jgi:hypothetical protein
VVPQRDFVSYLSSEWSIILVGLARLFPSFVGDDAQTDNLSTTTKRCLLFDKILILTFHFHTSKPRMCQYFFGAWPTSRIDLEHETKELEKLRNIGLRGSLFRMRVFFFTSIVFKSRLPAPIGDLLRDSWARKSVNENILNSGNPQYVLMLRSSSRDSQ